MTGANHCCDRPLALLGVGDGRPERADPSPLGVAQCRFDPLAGSMLPGRRAVLFADPGELQFLLEPPLAVAAAGKRLRSCKRKGRVVDVPELGKAARERTDVGLAFAAPAALADFPSQIGGQLRAAGRVPSDIAKSELLEPLRVEGNGSA